MIQDMMAKMYTLIETKVPTQAHSESHESNNLIFDLNLVENLNSSNRSCR